MTTFTAIGSPMIGKVSDDQDLYDGTFSLSFKDETVPPDVRQIIEMRLRFTHTADATFEALEAKLFATAARHLSHAAQLVAKETAESLRQHGAFLEHESSLAAEREAIEAVDAALSGDLSDFRQ